MKKIVWACCIWMAAIAVSCSKDKIEDPADPPGNGPGNPPGGGTELPQGALRQAGAPVPGTLVQKQIGASGGEIVMGKVKFIFPAGALASSVNFKVQQIENTAPNGIDSFAYRFETSETVETTKPIKMVYTFPRDEDNKPYVPGGDPAAIGGVTFYKTEANSTAGVYLKQPGKPVIDASAGTATQEFPLKISNGKLDIVNFLRYKLWINTRDGDSVSTTTVLCDDEIDYKVTYLEYDYIDDDLIVPLVDEKGVGTANNNFITLINVNGNPMGDNKTYGYIRSNNTENKFTYHAPYVVPGGAQKTSRLIAVSVDITAIKGDVSKYYLVSNVKLINESSVTIKGKTHVNLRASALEERGRKHIGIDISNIDHGGVRASAWVEINELFDGTGEYKMNYPTDLYVLASANGGEASYGSGTPDPDTNGGHQYGDGSVIITRYDRVNKVVKGTYSFTLVRTHNGAVERLLVSGTFHTPVTISQ